MKRHSADLFSLVAGLLTLGLGLLLLTGGVGHVPMEWVGPAVAIGVGLLIVVAALPDRGSGDDVVRPTDDA
jgi:TRAP-type C4-dicarboxylate transport system permease small subunit